MNGSVFSISFLACLLMIHGETSDLCAMVLYCVTLMKVIFQIQEFSGGVFTLILSAEESELTLTFIVCTLSLFHLITLAILNEMLSIFPY